MDALILSCSTGGGHNAAGFAIKEELEARGHRVTMMDPYELVSHKLAEEIAGLYVKMVQRSPKLFGIVYTLGKIVRHVPGKSPVYYVNISVAKRLQDYLEENPVDVIIMPHLYPAELVTYLKKQEMKLPLTIFIATDYVCIPFTEETNCDYYVVPGERQIRDFTKRGIPRQKILPFGIPVSRAFDESVTKREARERLGLDTDENKKYILITGGSIGAGDLSKNIRILRTHLRKKGIDGTLIVVCGSNERLYERLEKRYVRQSIWGKWDKNPRENGMLLLRKTKQMALYMRACDIFISKPGGLSSTEAAVANVPYIHMRAIPGCETYNLRFFRRNGMSLSVKHPRFTLAHAVRWLWNAEHVEHMQKKQRENILSDSRVRICDWIEEELEARD
ncbi:MAG: hypothetical protein NC180_11715 [Muribaculaceae bacterium]|nr:hypothetical protein [Roseburia sp.]MCM1430051.1 hypothetical protein [Muribaculaceae bacterium]MCM1493876.1 hypothetical protein [Muribaculaceae bacterium]